MPQFEMEGANELEFKALDSFTQGYIEAMFFTDSGPEEGQLGDAGFNELASETLKKIVKDCTQYQFDNVAALLSAYERDYDETQAGRDFWFTRNGHGVGFWDREELEPLGLADTLSEAARAFCGTDSYIGDDGKVYLS